MFTQIREASSQFEQVYVQLLFHASTQNTLFHEHSFLVHPFTLADSYVVTLIALPCLILKTTRFLTSFKISQLRFFSSVFWVTHFLQSGASVVPCNLEKHWYIKPGLQFSTAAPFDGDPGGILSMLATWRGASLKAAGFVRGSILTSTSLHLRSLFVGGRIDQQNLLLSKTKQSPDLLLPLSNEWFHWDVKHCVRQTTPKCFLPSLVMSETHQWQACSCHRSI